MTDEHIAGDFADVLEEAQIVRVVLNPRYFEVTINICAVCVAISQVFKVELAV